MEGHQNQVSRRSKSEREITVFAHSPEEEKNISAALNLYTLEDTFSIFHRWKRSSLADQQRYSTSLRMLRDMFQR